MCSSPLSAVQLSFTSERYATIPDVVRVDHFPLVVEHLHGAEHFQHYVVWLALRPDAQVPFSSVDKGREFKFCSHCGSNNRLKYEYVGQILHKKPVLKPDTDLEKPVQHLRIIMDDWIY